MPQGVEVAGLETLVALEVFLFEQVFCIGIVEVLRSHSLGQADVVEGLH